MLYLGSRQEAAIVGYPAISLMEEMGKPFSHDVPSLKDLDSAT